MSTVTRPELSKKNPYYLEKHRFYELKHFCLQYNIWEKAYDSLDGFNFHPQDLNLFSHVVSNPTQRCAIAKEFYSSRMELVDRACKEADPDLMYYLKVGVTEGVSYEVLNARYHIPCCKDTYYTVYRRFFWILNKLRD